MSTAKDSLKFTMTSRALKLLGQNLYAHPWSAVSELVANGIDAGATTIYVSMTEDPATNTGTLEVLDNGSGMSENDLQNYVFIGFDKRTATGSAKSSRAPMGRKGIGKLAALYLSNEYYIHTKTALTAGPQFSSAWHMKLDFATADDREPTLNEIDPTSAPSIHLEKRFNEQDSGTLITIPKIELKGLGTQAFRSLASRLAIHFLNDVIPDLKIYFSQQRVDEQTNFKEVDWKPAFGNFLLISTTKSHSYITANLKQQVEIQSASRQEKSTINTEIVDLPSFNLTDLKYIIPTGDNTEISGTYIDPNEGSSHPYSLKGWLALHASINNETATNNDPTFNKNRFFSPTQIRLYVRGKLALEDLRPHLNLTEQYANYLEGEIQFDLLDEDDLKDIATTSRESFDTEDPRFVTLCSLIRSWAQKLIQRRAQIRKLEKAKQIHIDNNANQAYERRVVAEIDAAKSITPAESAALKQVVQLGLTRRDPLSRQAQAQAKEAYRIFISHSRKNKPIADIIYNMLLTLGAHPEEIFYSSKDKESTENTKQLKQLQQQIHDTITSAATKICYITSKGFCSSVYCCFEGGAGWATRAVSDYELITTTYENKPEWLNTGLQTSSIIDANGVFSLNRETYLLFAETINRLVDHLNTGRTIRQQPLVNCISETLIPSDYELRKKHQDISDFFNEELADMITDAGTYDHSSEVFDKKCTADEDCPLKSK